MISFKMKIKNKSEVVDPIFLFAYSHLTQKLHF